MYVCWSTKGGSGTTVVTVALALLHSHSRPTLVVDLGGDVPAALGIAQPCGPGLTEWMASPGSDADMLHRLSVPATDGLSVLPRGDEQLDLRRWPDLLDALITDGDQVIVDAGIHVPPDRFDQRATSLLVIRPCYLALRRLAIAPAHPDAVVLVSEPGRALGVKEVEHTAKAPVVAQVPWDPAVARAVDAGLLASRIPPSLQQPLRGAA